MPFMTCGTPSRLGIQHTNTYDPGSSVSVATPVSPRVTTLGPSARGTCRLHAAIMARPARTSRRMVMHTLPSGSGACQQDDPGHPPELLPLGLGIQLGDDIPNAREGHRPLQTERFLPHRAEFPFLPALRLEE